MNTLELAQLANYIRSQSWDFLRVIVSDINHQPLARQNCNFGGSNTTIEEIVAKLDELPLGTEIEHLSKLNQLTPSIKTTYKKAWNNKFVLVKEEAEVIWVPWSGETGAESLGF